jgi:hypothetical protein
MAEFYARTISNARHRAQKCLKAQTCFQKSCMRRFVRQPDALGAVIKMRSRTDAACQARS